MRDIRVQILLNKGDELRTNGKYMEAIRFYLDALYEARKDWNEGIKNHEWQGKVITIACHNMGICYAKSGHVFDAVDNFQDALRYAQDGESYITIEKNLDKLLEAVSNKTFKTRTDQSTQTETVYTLRIPDTFKNWYGQTVFVRNGPESSLYIYTSQEFTRIIKNLENNTHIHTKEINRDTIKSSLATTHTLYIGSSGTLPLSEALTKDFLKDPGIISYGKNQQQLVVYNKNIGLSAQHYFSVFFRTDLATLEAQVSQGTPVHAHLHITDFFLQNNRNDILKHIPSDRLGYFLSFLACGCLFNQVFYTYFPEFYDTFRKEFKFPLITWSVGHCSHINPWSPFDRRITRKLHSSEVQLMFEKTIAFIVDRIRDQIKDLPHSPNWHDVVYFITNDSDIKKGPCRFSSPFVTQMQKSLVA